MSKNISKNIKNDILEKDLENLENENELIEAIINNSLIEDVEDIEEEDDEEEEEDIEEGNYIGKNKNTEENKKTNIIIKVNVNSNDSQDCNKEKSFQIYQDILENLLIDLFEYHFYEISQEKKKRLRNKILESKYHIEFFCIKSNADFSKHVLCILKEKIYELIKYIVNIIKKMKENDTISLKNILKVKNSLNLTGKDIIKIFDKAFQRTQKFDISSVIISLFITNFLSKNFYEKITDEEIEKIMEIDSLEEKDHFEKYIEDCKISLPIIKEDEKYQEEVKKENIENKNEINEKISVDTDNQNNYLIQANNKIDKNIKNENIKEKNIINNNESDQNNSKNIEKNKKNYSNLEELMEYINGNDNKKKKKKRRKKKSKVANKNHKIEKIENVGIERDIVFENFKSNLINFSDNLNKEIKKIKPIISDAFIEKLKLIN